MFDATSTLHREIPIRTLPPFVMAALEAAIQTIRATVRWRRDWMAGSSPAMTSGVVRDRHCPVVLIEWIPSFAGMTI